MISKISNVQCDTSSMDNTQISAYRQLFLRYAFASIILMNQAETLIELIANNLVEGNCQVLENLASEEGLNQSISQGIKTIATLFRGYMQKSESDLLHIEFYRDMIRRLGGEAEVTEDELNDYFIINKQDKQGLMPMLKKISGLKKSKEMLQSKLSTVVRQNQELHQDLRRSVVEAGDRSSLMESIHQYESKQEKLKRQCKELELQLLQLKQNCEKYEQKINILQQQCQELKKINSEIKSQLQRQSIMLEQERKRKISTETEISLQKNKILNLLQKIQQQAQQIDQLRSKISILEEKLAKAQFQGGEKGKEILIGSNSILGYLGSNRDYTNVLLEAIEQQVNKNVVSIQSIYNYAVQSAQNFHRSVDDKKNVMLICMTEQNEVIGAFSSAGFSLKDEQGKTIAFLFKLKDKAINIYRLKPGKKSITYDYDYIIFGNEQLCIQCGSNILSSYYVSGPRNSLHYEPCPNIERDVFLSDNIGENEVKLKNYQIVEVNFDSV